MRLLSRLLIGLSVAVSLSAATLGSQVAVAAGPGPLADPAVGPHARDDAAHRTQRLNLAPARTAIIARQARRSATNTGAAAAAAAGSVNPGPLQREVLGFATYWEIGNNASWNYSLLSTVASFGLDLKSDGSFDTTTSGWNGWGSQNLVDTINRAHAAGDRAVVVIKSFNNATLCAITYGSGQTAINNTIAAIRSKSLDGVNVDFEGSNTTCPNGQSLQAGITSFMAQLSFQVHQAVPGSYVSVDTYSGSASWDGGEFNIGQLSPVVDAMFVMAYDMAFGNMSGHAGPNAPLNGWTYNDTTSVSQYLTKAPASKVILGVPYYGYKWSTTTNAAYGAAQPGSSAEADTYSGILGDFSCGAQQLTHNWDSTAQSPWASWWSPATNDPCQGNHNSWRELYYDDATSLGLKYDLVNSNNLQGTGMWALGYDGTSPDLWQALADKFLNPWPGQYHPMAPARILDTRYGIGGHSAPVSSNQAIDVAINGQGGIPANGVAAVVLNVTAVGPTHAGFLTVYPTGTPRPTASNVNFVAGQTVPNLVQVAIGKRGSVSLYNLIGNTNVIFDVAGWVSTAFNTSGNAGRYQPMAPARLLDTRDGSGDPGGVSSPLGQGQPINLAVTGHGGVPATGVSAVVLNLTVTNPTVPSFLTAYPTGGTVPNTSNLNFLGNQTLANRAIVAVGDNGNVSFYNRWGQTNLVVDVSGWFTDSSTAAATGQFSGVAPARIVDTRIGLGYPTGLTRGSVTIQIAGRGGVPPMTAGAPPTAVVLNVTVTNPNAPGFLTVYPSGSTPPTASDVNFVAGQTVPNLVIVRLNTDGTIRVFNFQGRTDVVIDVFGYYG